MKFRKTVGAISAVAFSGLAVTAAYAAPAGNDTELLTAPAAGGASTGAAFTSVITPDGRYVAFSSNARDLVAGTTDTDDIVDVFVRDTRTGVTKKVSTGIGGAQGDGNSQEPDITPDARYVVFTSFATNLTEDAPEPGYVATYLKDLRTGTTTKIFTGERPPEDNRLDFDPSVSSDGSTVAFTSTSSALVPGDTNDQTDVFVWKRATQAITRVSISSGGDQAVGGESKDSQISGDGKTVVFRSGAANLVAGDTNEISDVFTHSLTSHRTTRISVGPQGQQATGGDVANHDGAGNPSISENGKVIAYEGNSLKGIVARDTGSTRQVYVYDQATGRTKLAAHTRNGGVAGPYNAEPVVSADGKYVVFSSDSNRIVNGDAGKDFDVFLREVAGNRIVRVTQGLNGEEPNAPATMWGSSVSNGGRSVTFTSTATNLVDNPVSGFGDLYLRHLG